MSKRSENNIPESVSAADLKLALNNAIPDPSNTAKSDKPDNGPYNGYTRKAFVAEVRSAMDDLDAKFDCHPMIMKLLILEAAKDLIELHTGFGLSQFEDGESKSAVAWLRDAGKLQTVVATTLQVELCDDFTIKE